MRSALPVILKWASFPLHPTPPISPIPCTCPAHMHTQLTCTFRSHVHTAHMYYTLTSHTHTAHMHTQLTCTQLTCTRRLHVHSAHMHTLRICTQHTQLTCTQSSHTHIALGGEMTPNHDKCLSFSVRDSRCSGLRLPGPKKRGPERPAHSRHLPLP